LAIFFPCTLCLKKRPHFYIFNNSAKNEQILIIFGVQNRVRNLYTHPPRLNNIGVRGRSFGWPTKTAN